MAKVFDLSLYWDKGIYKQLKSKKVRENFVVTYHVVIFNEDTDISAINLWVRGDLITED